MLTQSPISKAGFKGIEGNKRKFGTAINSGIQGSKCILKKIVKKSKVLKKSVAFCLIFDILL
jgi:hypothetical protein